ncbi:MAG: hypothetical protein ABSG19_14740 [Candidatus Aminicenantales bacterium]
MKNGDNYEIEGRLKTIRLTPAPPGLREKILGAAQERKEATAWTTPLLRKCLAGCAVLLAVIFIADAGANRTQNARAQAVLDGTRITQTDEAKQWNAELEELRDALGPGGIARERSLQARQKIKPSSGPGDEIW